MGWNNEWQDTQDSSGKFDERGQWIEHVTGDMRGGRRMRCLDCCCCGCCCDGAADLLPVLGRRDWEEAELEQAI